VGAFSCLEYGLVYALLGRITSVESNQSKADNLSGAGGSKGVGVGLLELGNERLVDRPEGDPEPDGGGADSDWFSLFHECEHTIYTLKWQFKNKLRKGIDSIRSMR